MIIALLGGCSTKYHSIGFLTDSSVEGEVSVIAPTLQGGKLSPTRVRGFA